MSQIPESAIVKAWQEMRRADLVTEDGEPVSVVYPGRVNRDQGPDLLDAVIRTGAGLVKGDIEVHARSSEWQSHHHHQDRVYNRVILHVVLRRDTLPRTELQNQASVPVLALGRHFTGETSVAGDSSAVSGLPCREACPQNQAAVLARLDDAGEERFRGKGNHFREQLAQQAPDQVLYEAVMEALGYTKNKRSFRELARRLPFRTLESAARDARSDGEALLRLQALLIGTAGLLPSQRSLSGCDGGYVTDMETRWASLLPRQVMSVTNWNLCRLRPGNFPTRRLAAMSYLVLRYREKGLADEVQAKIADSPVEPAHRELEKMFIVNTAGYWVGHFDFGTPVNSSPTLLGAERAAEIVVNAALPFVDTAAQTGVAAKAREIYRRYPRLAANALERHMAGQLNLERGAVNSACRQQGLLHIYKTRCSQGECGACPLASAETVPSPGGSQSR